MITHPEVENMLAACPFLRDKIEPSHLDLPTVALGEAATLAIAGSLSSDQQDQLFNYWNRMAETADDSSLGILSTGALELFNDSADAQNLARAKLTGKARSMHEEMRLFWGQPDYSGNK